MEVKYDPVLSYEIFFGLTQLTEEKKYMLMYVCSHYGELLRFKGTVQLDFRP